MCGEDGPSIQFREAGWSWISEGMPGPAWWVLSAKPVMNNFRMERSFSRYLKNSIYKEIEFLLLYPRRKKVICLAEVLLIFLCLLVLWNEGNEEFSRIFFSPLGWLFFILYYSLTFSSCFFYISKLIQKINITTVASRCSQLRTSDLSPFNTHEPCVES